MAAAGGGAGEVAVAAWEPGLHREMSEQEPGFRLAGRPPDPTANAVGARAAHGARVLHSPHPTLTLDHHIGCSIEGEVVIEHLDVPPWVPVQSSARPQVARCERRQHSGPFNRTHREAGQEASRSGRL